MPQFGSLILVFILAQAGRPLPADAASAGTVHIRFEPQGSESLDQKSLDQKSFDQESFDQESIEQTALRVIGANQTHLNPGPLVSPVEQSNAGSMHFDGRTSIAYTIPSNTAGFSQNFTWEGFFLTPAANQYLTETGIADRLISQFANDAGDWTRLAVGLVADSQGRPRLCVELEGYEGRTFGLGKLPVIADRWHHFAVVHEGTAAAAKISWYLDYQLCGELFLGGQADQNTLKPPGSAALSIGARLKNGDTLNRGFQGWIDEIRLTPQPLGIDQFLRTAAVPSLQSVEIAVSPDEFWQQRHQWAARQAAKWRGPPSPDEGNPIDAFIERRLEQLNLRPAQMAADGMFFRRLSLDARGRIPTRAEIETFSADRRADKRLRAVDLMLSSGEWADSWVGYWQDVLAENPSVVFPTLNNSGPFRRWIYESFRDNVPFDRFATELILMDGENEVGGTAGFAQATQNDVPLAMKAHVVMQAFWAVELKCARCHDSPLDEVRQEDLFRLAAMLNEGALEVPETSVAAADVTIDGRRAAVSTSLEAGKTVPPAWPTWHIGPPRSADEDLMPIHDRRSRAALAALITSPKTARFSDVLVNRVWKRYLGAGLVEPLDNWNDGPSASHPELLRYLSHWFVDSGYDVKALARLILTSNVYGRAVDRGPASASRPNVFAAQQRRRLSAEQLIDSLFLAVGKSFQAETMAVHATDPGAVDLPRPNRAWQFVALPNERDRPALGMPVSQTIVDVMTTFGWRGSRQQPRTERDTETTALQPLILFNGLMSQRIVRLSDRSAITELCLQELSAEELVDKLFLTVLSREASGPERQRFVALLEPGFHQRRTGKPKKTVPPLSDFQPDWRKHLEAEQTRLMLAAEKKVARGEPPTERLAGDFRERVEDALWVLINSPEFVFVP